MAQNQGHWQSRNLGDLLSALGRSKALGSREAGRLLRQGPARCGPQLQSDGACLLACALLVQEPVALWLQQHLSDQHPCPLWGPEVQRSPTLPHLL